MFHRHLSKELKQLLSKGKSILLLGPRQVGKTTLAMTLDCDLKWNLAVNKDRQAFERNPDLLAQRIQDYQKKKPFIFIDEIQKVPSLLNEIQHLIDEKKAQFLLTGSSARKLKHEVEVNLIPGRILNLRMDPLCSTESSQPWLSLIQYGQLPQILTESEKKMKTLLLKSYIENYIEDEIRKETKIRNIANYSRFLELAAIQSGKVTNFSEISKELGPTITTIQSYYQVLEDTLFADRIDPYLKNSQRKKLTKSSKYLFFDLGVRRFCAHESVASTPDRQGELFEHLIGNELLKWIRLRLLPAKLYFWRDSDGPEVDWLIEYEGHLLPIEVKCKEKLEKKDARHLYTFLSEYASAQKSFLVGTNSFSFDIDEKVRAVAWTELFQNLDQWVADTDKT